MQSIKWNGNELILLDQTKLPGTISYLHCTDWRQAAEAIKMLRVRGAPAIGVAAGYAMILAAREAMAEGTSQEARLALLYRFGRELQSTRPTAINLAWAISRIFSLIGRWEEDASKQSNLKEQPQEEEKAFSKLISQIEAEAVAIDKEDLALNQAMAEAGADIFQGRSQLRILTHCNAGALATAGLGTALGVVRRLYERGQLERVYADETRPLLQGARLTAFELMEDGIPVTLLTDNMAAYAMQQGLIDAVIVGADRITTKGDVANKIGTYGVALLAKAHNLPFYVAAPYSTFDFTMSDGNQIPIEMRDPEEVRTLYGAATAPAGVDVLNPAFDVTSHELITAIITEKGVLKPTQDFSQAISRLRSAVKGEKNE